MQSPHFYERPPQPVGINGLTAIAQQFEKLDRSVAKGLASHNLECESPGDESAMQALHGVIAASYARNFRG